MAFEAPVREFTSFKSPYSRGVEADLWVLPASLAKELHRYRVRIQLALVPSVDVRRVRLSSGGETIYGSSSGGILELMVMAEKWDVVFSWREFFGDAIKSITFQLDTGTVWKHHTIYSVITARLVLRS